MTALTEPRYPIRAVSRLTGVPVDTLRAWERRHRAVEPHRDARGRLYTQEEVGRIRLLRDLVARGHAIGRLASLPAEALESLDGAAPGRPGEGAAAVGPGHDLTPILSALRAFDGDGAERELRRLAALLPPRPFVREVALPLLRAVGDEWFAGRLSVAQEHLASAALRNLLGSLLRVHAPEAARASVLLATPSGERHEFGILAAAMLAVTRGVAALYLGPDVPAGDIVAAATRARPRAVVLGVIAALGTDGPAAALRAVARDLPRGTALWVGGPPRPEIQAATEQCGAAFLPDLDALEAQLARLAG